jgi:hypothetical protein
MRYPCVMNTKRHKQMVTFTIDPDVIERLKAWIDRQEPQPRQNAVVETAIKRFLDENEPDGEKSQKSLSPKTPKPIS